MDFKNLFWCLILSFSSFTPLYSSGLDEDEEALYLKVVKRGGAFVLVGAFSYGSFKLGQKHGNSSSSRSELRGALSQPEVSDLDISRGFDNGLTLGLPGDTVSVTSGTTAEFERRFNALIKDDSIDDRSVVTGTTIDFERRLRRLSGVKKSDLKPILEDLVRDADDLKSEVLYHSKMLKFIEEEDVSIYEMLIVRGRSGRIDIALELAGLGVVSAYNWLVENGVEIDFDFKIKPSSAFQDDLMIELKKVDGSVDKIRLLKEDIRLDAIVHKSREAALKEVEAIDAFVKEASSKHADKIEDDWEENAFRIIKDRLYEAYFEYMDSALDLCVVYSKIKHMGDRISYLEKYIRKLYNLRSQYLFHRVKVQEYNSYTTAVTRWMSGLDKPKPFDFGDSTVGDRRFIRDMPGGEGYIGHRIRIKDKLKLDYQVLLDNVKSHPFNLIRKRFFEAALSFKTNPIMTDKDADGDIVLCSHYMREAWFLKFAGETDRFSQRGHFIVDGSFKCSIGVDAGANYDLFGFFKAGEFTPFALFDMGRDIKKAMEPGVDLYDEFKLSDVKIGGLERLSQDATWCKKLRLAFRDDIVLAAYQRLRGEQEERDGVRFVGTGDLMRTIDSRPRHASLLMAPSLGRYDEISPSSAAATLYDRDRSVTSAAAPTIYDSDFLKVSESRVGAATIRRLARDMEEMEEDDARDLGGESSSSSEIDYSRYF